MTPLPVPRGRSAAPRASAMRLLFVSLCIALCNSSAAITAASGHADYTATGGYIRQKNDLAVTAVTVDTPAATTSEDRSWWSWFKRILHIGAASDNSSRTNEQQNVAPAPFYDESTAVYLARVTSVAYCQARHIRNWTCSPCALVDPLEEIQVVEDAKSTFQGLVGFNSDQNTIVVAFRGSMDITNWIDNLTFVKKKAYAQYPDVRVHQGFYWVFQSVASQIIPAVKKLRTDHPSAQLVITGHSLGGAVAALCGFELSLLQQLRVDALYTFGEPRVGNTNFSALLNSAVEQVYRVTHFRDVVPHLPPSWIGFRHASQEIYYDEFASNFTVCDPRDGEDPLCSDACSPFGCTSVVDHLTYVNVTMSHLIC